MTGTIGIDLGGTTLRWFDGSVEGVVPTGRSFAPSDLLETLRQLFPQDAPGFEGLGLAVPGLVDADGTIVESDVLPAFDGWRAAAGLAGSARRVVVLNDVRAALVEEMRGAADSTTGGVVMVGTAVGSAWMADGRVLNGANGWAGELGYLPVFVGDRRLRLDDLAGGAALSARLGLAPAEVARRAVDGDPRVLAAIDEAGGFLGTALAAMVNVFNPSRIVVGGGTTELPGYFEAALRSAAQVSIPRLWRGCAVSRANAGVFVVARGARRAAIA